MKRQPNFNVHFLCSSPRSLPASFKDRKSEKQILHRKKFKAVGELFAIFRSALRFEKREDNLNLFGTFYKLNWNNVSVTLDSVSIDYQNLLLTNHLEIKLPELEISHVEKKVFFKWKADALLDNSFYVLCAVYCKGANNVYVNIVKRTSLFAEVNIPFSDREIFTYAYTYTNFKN